jgi:hypothetical protein
MVGWRRRRSGARGGVRTGAAALRDEQGAAALEPGQGATTYGRWRPQGAALEPGRGCLRPRGAALGRVGGADGGG